MQFKTICLEDEIHGRQQVKMLWSNKRSIKIADTRELSKVKTSYGAKEPQLVKFPESATGTQQSCIRRRC